jgi:hemerythrin-like domain-containing protein
MSTTIEILGTQHQEVLARLDSVEGTLDGHGDLAAFLAYLERDVMQHFAVEEEALFPILAHHLSLSQGPLAVMNAEHAAFRELLGNLRTAVGTADRAAQRMRAQELIELLRAHIAKEDHVLFPMASQLLSVDEQQEVDARAAAIGTSAASAHA